MSFCRLARRASVFPYTTLFRSVGFYDPTLRTAGEDQVLAAKLRAKGYEVYQAPDLPYRRSFARSEEHTSELQSRLHLVCRLLLEKKIPNALLALHAE